MFCLDDGTELLQATAGSGDPNATLRMPAPRSTDPGPTVASAKAPTLVEQPLKPQAEPQPFVSPGSALRNALERARFRGSWAQ